MENNQFSPVYDIRNKNFISAVEDYFNNTDDNSLPDEPFYVLDFGMVNYQHLKWKTNLPKVKPFYAVKSNNDSKLLDHLANQLNLGFDCASKGEIQSIIQLGVSTDRIIFAHPCKPVDYLRYAKQIGLKKMTFDNLEELEKIKNYYPEAELVLRIYVDDTHSVIQLGKKFGVDLESSKNLLENAKKMDLNVIGVSFHVGCECTNASAYYDAIKRAKEVFDQGKGVGLNFKFLDIGGGFPSLTGVSLVQVESFENIAKMINKGLCNFFPEEGIEVIGEPGRYYCSDSFSLFTSIIGKKVKLTENQEKKIFYYINDSLLGSFNNILCGPEFLYAYPTFLSKKENSSLFSYLDKSTSDFKLFNSTLIGNNIEKDLISENLHLPELKIGDWLIYQDMGAYKKVVNSATNKFKVFYLNSENLTKINSK